MIQEFVSDALAVKYLGGDGDGFLYAGIYDGLMRQCELVLMPVHWPERRLDDGRFLHYSADECKYHVNVECLPSQGFLYRLPPMIEWIAEHTDMPWCLRVTELIDLKQNRQIYTGPANRNYRFSFDDVSAAVAFTLVWK
jgi:hypothetical protein